MTPAPAETDMAALKFDRIPEGYRVFDGDKLVAVVTTSQHMDPAEVTAAVDANQMDAKFVAGHAKGHGPVAWKLMPPAGWTIHLTGPALYVDLFKAIAAGIPAR